jgi:hypothetical protein
VIFDGPIFGGFAVMHPDYFYTRTNPKECRTHPYTIWLDTLLRGLRLEAHVEKFVLQTSQHY